MYGKSTKIENKFERDHKKGFFFFFFNCHVLDITLFTILISSLVIF